MSIVLFVLFGLSVGLMARSLVPGSEPVDWLVSVALGVLGSGFGAFFGRIIGLYREGQPAEFLAAIAGATLLVLGYHAMSRRRRWHQEREIQ